MRDQSLENLDFGSRAFVRKTHENDSMVYLSFFEDLFSEILIVGPSFKTPKVSLFPDELWRI